MEKRTTTKEEKVQAPTALEAPMPVATPKDNLSIPLAIVFAGVLIAGAILFTQKSPAPTQVAAAPARDQAAAQSDNVPAALLALNDKDHVYGNPNADTLIIEYSDPECPFCKNFDATMNQVMDNYGKDGSVAWVYRHFPLDQLHPKARKEAEALECANELGGNDAFWKYTNKIFEVTPSNNGLDAAQLPVIATAVGLDATAFNTCLASGKYASRVESDFENGAAVGVKGTPYAIVWNRKTGKQLPINGAYPYGNVKTILDMVITAPADAVQNTGG